ncbi:hypothetical protein ACLOJK_005021 [Asimina triloba]
MAAGLVEGDGAPYGCSGGAPKIIEVLLPCVERVPPHNSKASPCRGPIRGEPHHEQGGVSKGLCCWERPKEVVVIQATKEEWAEETVVGLLKDLDVVKLEQERAKEAIIKLLVDLDATKVERDKAVDDAKAIILAKRDLE